MITPPDGFAYRDDALTPAEERACVKSFAGLPFKPFEFHGYLGKRRIVSFGWHYDYSGRALRPSTPMPNFLETVRTHLRHIYRKLGVGNRSSLCRRLANLQSPGPGGNP